MVAGPSSGGRPRQCGNGRTAGEAHFEADTRLGLPDPRVVLDILKELLTVRRQLKEDSRVHADQTHVL